MLKFTIIAILLGVSSAAPAAEPVAAPHAKPEPSPAAPIPYSAPAPVVAAPLAPIAYSAPVPAPAPAAVAPALAIEPKSIIDPSFEAKAALHHEAPAHVAHIPAVQGDQPALAQAPVEAEGHQPVAIAAAVPSAKQLLLAEAPLLKTPASTAKLTPLAAPIIAPISPLAYAAGPAILAPFPAWNGLTAYPATYSIEQHGYHITY